MDTDNTDEIWIDLVGAGSARPPLGPNANFGAHGSGRALPSNILPIRVIYVIRGQGFVF